MKTLFLASSTLALLAGPAAALTGAELWADWQETMSSLGAELTAEEETQDGDRLVLTGVTATQSVGGDGEVATRYGDVTLIDQGDGSVRIEAPSEMRFSQEVVVEGETLTMEGVMRYEGLDAVVRDEGGVRVYDMSADTVGYEFEDLSSGQEATPVSMNFTVTDMESTTRIDEARYEGTIGGSLSIEASQPSATDAFSFSYALADMEGEIAGTIPEIDFTQDVPNMAEWGLEYDMSFSHSGSSSSLSATTPDGPLQWDSTSASGGLTATLTPQGLSYGMSSTETAATIVPPGMPLPVNASIAETAARVVFPLAPNEDGSPSDFVYETSLRDLAIDDALWSLFDPTGQLPRDPASLTIDVTGTLDVLYNMLDLERSTTSSEPPFFPETLDINEVMLSVAGAELRANGAMSFEVDGVGTPIPDGQVTVELDGAYGLLDKLVALGFVPPGQVAIARGMAGAVAQQVGDDQLRSELAFGPNGITANGLPLPF